MSAALLSSPRDYLLLFLFCCLVICAAAITLGVLAYRATTKNGKGYPRAKVPDRLNCGRVEPEARRLRGKGMVAREIGERLGVPESTIRNWYLGGNCTDCGALIQCGSRAREARRCSACSSRAQVIWTKEVVIDRVREWCECFGNPPAASDWNPWVVKSAAREEVVARFDSGDWPDLPTVQRLFGSWNRAIAAAGFAPRNSGDRGPDRPAVQRQKVAA